MKTVDRFVAFSGWSTSRKSALLYGLALPLHLVATLLSHLVLPRVGFVDSELVLTVFWVWNLELAACFLISLAVARRGHEGRWTLWLNMIPYGLFLMVIIGLFGFVSTAFVIWYPSVIVLVAVWYSPREGLFAFVYGMLLIAAYAVLLYFGELPYAPAMTERAIDAQNSLLWTAYVFVLVLSYFSFCFVLVALLFWAQRVQQSRLQTAHHRLERSHALIGRYVPRQLAQRIVEGQHPEAFRPERVRLSLVSARILDLAETSDDLDADEMSVLLNESLSAMAEVAERFQGTVSQLNADGIQIFFGAPQPGVDRDDAVRAVAMALAMQARMEELRALWTARGIERPWRICIGINTGVASVGDFGSEGRKSYSAIGVQAIIAARIRAHCLPGEVWISEATCGLVQHAFELEDRGELSLTGLHYPVRAYRVRQQIESVAPPGALT